MTNPYRTVIFAAVSGKPQAADDKDSLPNQIRRARKIIERRGWEEVHDPIVVPGHTRSIDFLHEAIEEIPEIAHLINIARQGELDLVICYDYDRLARTRALLTQLSAYFSRCKVQIYAMDKPVEPIPPNELGMRGRGVRSAAMVEAFAGIEAESEISRIVERHHYGMNAGMRKGHWRHARVAYGYTRISAEHSADAKTVYLDIPVIVTEKAAIVQRMDKMFLDGAGANIIARTLNLEGMPGPRGKQWHGSTILNILKNPFYCGYVVWGLTRTVTEFSPEAGGFVTKRRKIPAVRELAKHLGRQPTIFDLLDHADELAQYDVVIVRGGHEPIRSEQTQRAIHDELQRRKAIGGRAADTSSPDPLLFSGLLRCAYCDSPFYAMPERKRSRIYYVCRARRTGRLCDNKKWIRENALYDRVMNILREIALKPGMLDTYIEQMSNRNIDGLREEKAGLVSALQGIAARIQRWSDAYEAEVINLETYGERLRGLEQERNRLSTRLTTIQRELDHYQDTTQRREEILTALQSIPAPDDRRATKVFLRRIIDKITIRDAQIERITLR